MSKQYPGGIISKTPVTPSGPYSNDTASGIWTLDQQAYWQKLGQWPNANNPPVDPQFNYVTMLLHGDGTNGAQNNTFLDSSSNTFSITRNGNTTQGSFSPYGSNWSNYSTGDAGSGSGTYLTTPSVSLSGDFTVEMWVFFDSASEYNRPFGLGNGSASDGGYIFNGGYLNAKMGSVSYSGGSGVVGWNHIAFSRASGALKIFLNGTQIASGSDSTTIAGAVSIGSYVASGTRYFGTSQYISNLRIVNGTALYTTTFTPPTASLTAVSGTLLLTCQSNRFVDNSASPLTITVNGTPSVQRFNPFGTATAYSTAVIGGSGYFDGSGDYLSCGSQSAYAFGTGDFTLNAWFYLTAAPTYMSIADTRSSGWALAIDASRAIYLYSDAVGFVVTSAVGAVPLNAWTYVTVTRVSGTMTLYLNAVSINSASNSTNFSNTTLAVGANPSGGEPFFGYICDFQAIKGTGTTPTLPTAPLTNVTNTSLLLNYTNGAIFDNAMMGDLETVGSAQILTSVKKYGTGSIYFDGSNSYLVTLGQPIYSFGTGDFTIECWLNITSFNGGVVFDFRPNGVNGDYITVYLNGSALEFYAGSTGRITSGTLTTATWFHFALCRSGSSTKMFINGTQAGSTYTASVSYTVGTKLGIGTSSFALASSLLDGYIDDLRITKGYARYTANFTPPTAAFFNSGPN
jgi:hypothetical protein